MLLLCHEEGDYTIATTPRKKSWDNYCCNFKIENRSDSKTMAATVKANMSLLGAPGSGESDWHECSKEVDQFVTGYDCSRPRDQNAIIDRGRTHIY